MRLEQVNSARRTESRQILTFQAWMHQAILIRSARSLYPTQRFSQRRHALFRRRLNLLRPFVYRSLLCAMQAWGCVTSLSLLPTLKRCLYVHPVPPPCVYTLPRGHTHPRIAPRRWHRGSYLSRHRSSDPSRRQHDWRVLYSCRLPPLTNRSRSHLAFARKPSHTS
jgi:hypothetical protein